MALLDAEPESPAPMLGLSIMTPNYAFENGRSQALRSFVRAVQRER